MAPQLQINQGPQDALLYDNTRSYFTNVGYVRTSNFQVEYRDVDSQNATSFGTTVQYVIPKAADLLGPVDLIVNLATPNDTSVTGAAAGDLAWAQWVDELGFAMIEKATLSIGSNDIETITGEQMQLKNELMTSDEQRLGFDHTLKTGRPAVANVGERTTAVVSATKAAAADGELHDIALKGQTAGLIAVGQIVKMAGTRIGVVTVVTNQSKIDIQTDATTPPATFATALAVDDVLSFFGPLITTNDNAGRANKRENKDYTRLIKLQEGATRTKANKRQLIIPLKFFFTNHVSQYFPLSAIAGCNDFRIAIKFRALSELVQIRADSANAAKKFALNDLWGADHTSIMRDTKLRCHYVHVTGPEATTLMNKEHVRLMKLWQHQQTQVKIATNQTTSQDISMNLSFLHPVSSLLIVLRRSADLNQSVDGTDDSAQKGYFFYHGDGTAPNYDKAIKNDGTDAANAANKTLVVENVQLTLNGQERHPGLSKGIDTNYLKHRLIPQLHSNSNALEHQLRASDNSVSRQVGYEMKGSKNVIVYPFSLNPEGSNPAGAVNFSKVSHAVLKMTVGGFGSDEERVAVGTVAGDETFTVDVYGMYYNWLQIKDGRALLSFA